MSQNEKRYYSTNDIEREALGHFFSKDAMRFFKSRVLETVYQGQGGVYFVTSEKGPSLDSKRSYTVRQYHTDTRSVSTAGDFNQLTKGKAQRLAAKLALGTPP